MKDIFRAILKASSSITIDGRTFKGDCVTINGDQVYVDGVLQDGKLVGPISISITGDVDRLDCATGTVTVSGSGRCQHLRFRPPGRGQGFPQWRAPVFACAPQHHPVAHRAAVYWSEGMKFEDAENQASAMINALGPGWVMDLHDTHGWRCQVKNGPCVVTYNENGVDYSAFIKIGPGFSGYSALPVMALDVAAGRMDTYLNRITAEREAVAKIIAGTFHNVPKEKR